MRATAGVKQKSSNSRCIAVRGLSSSSSVSGPEHHSSPLYGCFFSRTQRRLLRRTLAEEHKGIDTWMTQDGEENIFTMFERPIAMVLSLSYPV